jgi:ribosomal protein S18 acetylase RimI-like enzyme
VARALLVRVDELARELRLHGVRLLVRPNNAPTCNLYRRAGFGENAGFRSKSDVKTQPK